MSEYTFIRFSFGAICWLMTLLSLGQELENDILKSEGFRKAGDPEREFEYLLSLRKKYQDHYEVVWRISRNYSEQAYKVDGSVKNAKTQKKQLFYKSLEFAELAKLKAPEKEQGYYNCALATGGIIQYGSYSEMASGSKVVKENIEKTIEINPNSHRALHALGRWHYEVARLSSFVKFMASLFYSDIPQGSFEDAANSFEKAIKTKDLIVHRLWLAKSYLRLEKKDQAIFQLRKASEMDEAEIGDDLHKQEVNKLLNELSYEPN